MQKTDPSTSSPPAASLESEESLPSRPNRSRSPSPRRVETVHDLQPENEHDIDNGQPRSFKRILVFCDGQVVQAHPLYESDNPHVTVELTDVSFQDLARRH